MAKKQLNFKFFSVKGFTLIELLVVLGILGILAAALLAAINPVEQLRKGQDTSLKNVATEFVASTTSYYSTLNALPWFSVVNGGANCYSGGSTLTAVGLGNLAGCITTLITNGELKSSFSQTTNLSKVTVTNPDPLSGNAGDVVACFAPQSKSQQLDPNTRYNSDGSIKAGCPAAGGACYWCAR